MKWKSVKGEIILKKLLTLVSKNSIKLYFSGQLRPTNSLRRALSF